MITNSSYSRNNINPDPSNIYDVIIVGAGPVGLATAIGLQKRGVNNILILDQTREFRPVGQMIDLAPNGLKALKCLDPDAYELVKEVSGKILQQMISQNQQTSAPAPPSTTPVKPPKLSSLEWVIRNCQGQPIRRLNLGFQHWAQQYGEGRLTLPWYQLQTCLREVLPAERICINHRCLHLVHELQSNCVRIDCVPSTGQEINPYIYWDQEPQSQEHDPQNSQPAPPTSKMISIRGKLVVGADGINSRVRQVLYQNTPYPALAQPEYSGFAAIICQEISKIPATLSQEIEQVFFQAAPVVTIISEPYCPPPKNPEISSIILFKKPNLNLGYMLHLPLALATLTGKSGTSLIEVALAALKQANFPDSLQQLVQLSPLEKVQQRPYYIHRATLSEQLSFPQTAKLHEINQPEVNPLWFDQRVVLVGDAAHGMPPFMAQGVNQGLEDALTVATLIADLSEKKRADNLEAVNL